MDATIVYLEVSGRESPVPHFCIATYQQAFDDEDPPPTREPTPRPNLGYPARQQAAERTRKRGGRVEEPDPER